MSEPARRVVVFLTAQSIAFGVMAALLAIAANAMFLEEYGSEWLPLTYVLIGAVGVVVSGAVARSSRSGELVRIAVVVLGVAVVLLVVAWGLAAGADAVWVSAPLLVLFPVLLQLGFVFIGAQAGRSLDIDGIKTAFPRIMAGFPIGATLGGLVGGPLVNATGRTEDLLLAAAGAQLAFVLLVAETGRRFLPTLPPAASATGVVEERPSMRRLLAGRFVLLILGYQILSALASQLSDFLVYDRAAARYGDAEDLARFVARYTAVMNISSIAFLALVAGPLLRRYGLRLGIAANPLVLTIFGVGALVAERVTGAGSVGVLLVVSAARIADIALTDGTTRTSVNAAYQVIPERERLPIQAAVEGVGVPVAIGLSGIVIIVLDLVPGAVLAMLATMTAACALWTWVALRLYRAYAPALVAALRRPTRLGALLDGAFTDEDAIRTRELLRSNDATEILHGLELVTSVASPVVQAELTALADHPSPDVRLAAITVAASEGSVAASARLNDEVEAASRSADAGIRRSAARALAAVDVAGRRSAAHLLEDPDREVRRGALAAVRDGDDFAVEAVVAAVADPELVPEATAALGRLGALAVPRIKASIPPTSPVPPSTARLLRSLDADVLIADDDLVAAVSHADRRLGLAVLERMVADEATPARATGVLDHAFAEDLAHAVRLLSAMTTVDPSEPSRILLASAIADEFDLVTRRVAAGRLARHGRDALGPPLLALAAESDMALAREAVTVTLGVTEANAVLAVLEPGRSVADRLEALDARPAVEAADLESCLRWLIVDADAQWREPWLTACAIDLARREGVLEGIDTDRARALRDAVVDEVLAG